MQTSLLASTGNKCLGIALGLLVGDEEKFTRERVAGIAQEVASSCQQHLGMLWYVGN